MNTVRAMPMYRGRGRALMAVFLLWILSSMGGALAQEPEDDLALEDQRAQEEAQGPVAEPDTARSVFSGGYPVRFARRPLVLDEGMARADGRATIGGAFGSGTFSSLDIGGALSPVEKLEVGFSTELTGAIPAPGGVGLISAIFSPEASYGDIPVYARYQYAESEVALAAVDLVLVLPVNTDFSMTAGIPLRIVEIFDLFTMDMSINIRYRNGDKYAAFIADPSKNTADFIFSGASAMNFTDNGFIEIGGGVALTNVGGGAGAKNVVELPFFLGGGYTHQGKVLADIFAQFGWEPLMTANGPPGVDTFNIKDDWFLNLGATVYTEALFGANKR